MSPLIYFQDLKSKVLKSKLKSYSEQTKIYEYIESYLFDRNMLLNLELSPRLASWMKNLAKKSEMFINTDDRALITEYGFSEPNDVKIKNRTEYMTQQLSELVEIIKKFASPNQFDPLAATAFASLFENRHFPIKKKFFEMEVMRMQFDSFGRFKYNILVTLEI